MAIDVYPQIEGIKGESQDDKHKDWIECASVHSGVHQPKSATASTGGGHTAERAELKEVTFTKLADLIGGGTGGSTVGGWDLATNKVAARPILVRNPFGSKGVPKTRTRPDFFVGAS